MLIWLFESMRDWMLRLLGIKKMPWDPDVAADYRTNVILVPSPADARKKVEVAKLIAAEPANAHRTTYRLGVANTGEYYFDVALTDVERRVFSGYNPIYTTTV